MLYGILLESCRDGISTVYGHQTWKRIVQELNFEHETFTILGRYEENMIERIAECELCFTFFCCNFNVLVAQVEIDDLEKCVRIWKLISPTRHFGLI